MSPGGIAFCCVLTFGSIQLEGELPVKCFQNINDLIVPRVTHEDSGTYVCTASNKQGKVEAFTSLQVHGESAEPSLPHLLLLPAVDAKLSSFRFQSG